MRSLAILACFSFLAGNTRAQSAAPEVRLLALRAGSSVVALAAQGERALAHEALELRVRRAHGGATSSTVLTDAEGLAVFELPSDATRSTALLTLRGPGSVAVAALEPQPMSPRPLHSTTCTLTVDRPVYRPGELVQASLFVRRNTFATPSGTCASEALVGEALALTLTFRDGRELPLALTTDLLGAAAFTWQLPEDASSGPVTLRVRGGALDRSFSPFEVRAFRRPTLHCTLSVPQRAATASATQVTVRANLAAGGAAAFRPGRLRIAPGIELPFELDRTGVAVVPIPQILLAKLGTHDAVRLEAHVFGADGVAARSEATLVLRAAPTPTPRALELGATFDVTPRGRPGSLAVVCIAHQRLLEARVVRFSADGSARSRFVVAEAWLPRVEVRVVGFGEAGRPEPCAPVQDIAISRPLRVHVEEAGRRFEPGAEVEVHLRATDELGAGRPCLLAVAVVDEQVYARFGDRATDPRDDLAPSLANAIAAQPVARDRTRGGAFCALSLRGLLRGWPLLVTRESVRGVTGGPSGALPATGSVALAPRSRFEATAHFAGALRTGSDGRATLRFRLPDDLTRWRITVVAVDHGINAARAYATLHAGKDLAITAALPRFLRRGDEVHATRFVHRALSSGEHDVATSVLPLRADGVGALPLRLAIEEGNLQDALVTSLPILPELTRVPWTTSSAARGRVELVPPPAASDSEPCELVVLPGREALLAEAARFVGEYPYGCVEQTTSRLLPHVTALRGGASLDAERARKLAAGFARLRLLLLAPDHGFRYWPGWSEVHRGMSAYVIHALCLARETGVDPARHGLVLTPGSGPFADLARRMQTRPQALDPEELALGIALARYAGPDSAHAKALARLVEVRPLAPRDLAAAALALPRTRARALLVGVAAGLDEEPIDVECDALRILALRGVEQADELVARLEARLLRASRDGRFGTTYATALAIAALGGRRIARAPGGPFTITVEQGDVRTDVPIPAERAAPIRVPLARSSPTVVQVPAGEDLVLVLRGRHAPRVPRELPVTLLRTLVECTGGRPIQRFVAVGQRLRMQVTLESRTREEYVALECPLPAGFEVDDLDPLAAAWEVQDARAVYAFRRLEPGRVTVELPLVASFAGEVAWPAPIAVAMYGDRTCGVGTHERVVVLAR